MILNKLLDLKPSEGIEKNCRSATSRNIDLGLLFLGIVITALSGNRFNIPCLGWVVSTPYLLFLRHMQWERARRDVIIFFAAVQIGVLLNSAKIITPPLPWLFAPFLSVQPALVISAVYLAFEVLRRILGDVWGALVLFPSVVVSTEWILGTVLEGSSWGSLAYTQIDDLALLQIVSLFGLGSVSFLLASSSAVTAVLLEGSVSDRHQGRLRALPMALTVAALVVIAQGWGSWRLERSLPSGPMVTVATIGSDLEFPIVLPSRDEVTRVEDMLFERTEQAADAGADVIVWNEVATVVLTKEDEVTLIGRGESLARKHNVDIVMGYAVPLDEMRRFENKYVWFGPEGKVETYHKHHPVPGIEGSLPGVEPLRVHNRTWGRAAGAICYDYDFPETGMAHARDGAGIVMVPSSDWRGIDQFHTKMASVRGIEGGFSFVRSVHAAMSGAYDALGRTLATLSWQDDGRRIMLARVPVTPIPTLYSQIGDVLPQMCLGVVVASVGAALIRGYQYGGVKQKTCSCPVKAKAA